MTKEPERRPADPTFGIRLRAARKRAGLSLEELAAQIGGIVTKQALSKYEKGRMMPSPEILELLGEALDIRPAEEEMLIGQLESEEFMESPPVAKSVVEIRDEVHYHKALDTESDAKLYRSRMRIGSDLPAFIKKMRRGSKKDPGEEREVLRLHEDMAFAPLAERRARYLEAWEPDSGPGRIRFREGEKLPARSASMLKHRVADFLERYLKLESLLGMRVRFENPIASIPIGTASDIEAAAAKVRSSWKLGLGPVVNLLGVLEDRGIRVFETGRIEGFEGLSGTFGSIPFIAVSRDLPLDRIRFTAAHELGHILGRFVERGKSEGMCHRFAGAFLLPREAAEKVFRRPGQRISMGELSDIKAEFGVSIQAIMGRAKDLGFVSDRQFRAFRETVKDRGWAVTEPVVYMGVEQAGRFRGLIRFAVAADIIDLDRASQLAGIPAAELKDEMGEVF